MWSDALEILRDMSPWTLFTFAIVAAVALVYVDMLMSPSAKHFSTAGSYDMGIACVVHIALGAVGYSIGGSLLAIAAWVLAVLASIPVLSYVGKIREKQNAWAQEMTDSWAKSGLEDVRRYH